MKSNYYPSGNGNTKKFVNIDIHSRSIDSTVALPNSYRIPAVVRVRIVREEVHLAHRSQVPRQECQLAIALGYGSLEM